ncbi:MAG: hypothetical protein ACJ8GN_01390 [Longimicrobiaceae bacterium]
MNKAANKPRVTAEYDVKRDARKRVTLRSPRHEYYHATEFADGTVMLEPRELRVPDSISRRTLEGIYAAVRNLDAGAVGDEFDLSEVQDLIDEP